MTTAELLLEMKQKKSYAGRGKELEKRVERTFQAMQAQERNFSYLRLNVPRLGNGTFLKKQPCDFVFNRGTKHVYIDCKETLESVFYISRIPAHQIHALERYQSQGNIAGFVVWFRSLDPAGVDVRFFQDFQENKTFLDGESWREFIEKL